ncbi:MAG: carboxypeptidase regulatory-like domain-containing protein [Blastocatellia bacterium]|nr:carboxypeptidase regulatory-like domain-containing protein [Blastocatellia bacterium]
MTHPPPGKADSQVYRRENTVILLYSLNNFAKPLVSLLLFMCFLLVESNFSTLAGTGKGTLAGLVRDQNGSAISGAIVLVRHQVTGATLNVSTDATGMFRLDSLPEGTYLLQATALGFTQFVQPVTLTGNQPTAVSVALEPAGTRSASKTDEEIIQLKKQLAEANAKIDKLASLVEGLQAKATPALSFPGTGTPTEVAATALPSPAVPQSLTEQDKKSKAAQDDPKAIDALVKSKIQGGTFSGSEGLFKNDRIKIGGYADFRYVTRGLDDGFEIRANADEENPGQTDVTNFKRNTFSSPQLILGVAAAITDKLVFNSEIEFEFAGKEVEIEQMYLEYQFNKKFNLRGGIVIPPLGRFNLFHDSNLRDIITRPLVSTFVIPSTYKDAGIGANGQFKVGRKGLFTYEGYVVNGLRSDEGGEIAREAGLFETKGNNRFFDNNPQKSAVGRLTYSPFIGTEIGVSGYRGKHDNRGQYDLSIWAFDGKYTFRDFQIVGEYARAAIGRAPETEQELAAKRFLLSLPKGDYVNTFDFIDANINEPVFDKAARSTDGFYLEARYRFHPKWLTSRTTEDATIAPVFRFDQVNLDRSYPDFRFPLNMRRASYGLSIRPTEAATFNFTYHHDLKPGLLLRLPDGRPFPPYFTNLGVKGFSFGMAYAF